MSMNVQTVVTDALHSTGVCVVQSGTLHHSAKSQDADVELRYALGYIGLQSII